MATLHPFSAASSYVRSDVPPRVTRKSRSEDGDVRVRDAEVRAVVREALVRERLEEQVDGLLVARTRVLVQRDAGLLWEPAVTPADAELVPALGQDVHDGDRRTRAPAGSSTEARAAWCGSGSASCAAPRRTATWGWQRWRTSGRRSARSPHTRRTRADPRSRSARAPPVELRRRLARVELDIRVQAEPHRAPAFPCDMSGSGRVSHRLGRLVNRAR